MIARRTLDVFWAFVFLTRLPLPHITAAPPALSRTMWAFPLVGATVGAMGGGILWLAEGVWHLPPLLAALLAVAGMVLATGALHEDGLADIADGFGGGGDRARKLEILRDSRIGAYGAVALVLSLSLRVVAVAEVPRLDTAVLALICAAALGRMAIPLGVRLMNPARPDGLGASAGLPGVPVVLGALAVGAGVVWLCLPTIFVPLIICVLGVSLAVSLLAHRQIGGYTGDVLGALAQLVEISALVVIVGGL